MSEALAAAESAAAAAKAAHYSSADPLATREAFRAAKTTLREQRWLDRGGLDNPYGARSYADFLTAQREQRKSDLAVTLVYGEDGSVTTAYGEGDE